MVLLFNPHFFSNDQLFVVLDNNVSFEMESVAISYQIVLPLRGSKGIIALIFYKRNQG
jgi:hypothetical protein